MRRARLWSLLLCLACALAACGTRAPLSTSLVDAREFRRNVIAGHSGKAQVLAALGPTTTQVFDSAYEVWLYRGAQQEEYVILFGPDGLVRKTRWRGPHGEVETDKKMAPD